MLIPTACIRIIRDLARRILGSEQRTGRWGRAIVILGALVYVGSARGAEGGNAPIVIMPLGDSITRGIGGNKAGYREPLYKALTGAGYLISYVGSETLDSTAFLMANGNDHHEGHGGYTISQIDAGLDGPTTGWLTGVPGVRDAVYPDVILLMAGTNDLAANITGAVALSRMDALLTKLSALRPAALIVVSTLVPYTYGPTAAIREQRNLDFNAGLPALVEAHRTAGHRVWLFDVRTRINSTVGGMGSDGLHPNQTGYNAMAAGWFEAIQKLPRIEAWRHVKFGNASETGSAANLADPDSDGGSNLVEYALGGEPKTGDAAWFTPQATVVTEAGADYLAMTFRRRRHADVNYTVETTSDPEASTWQQSAVPTGVPISVDDAFEQVTWRDQTPVASQSGRFMRLRISRP